MNHQDIIPHQGHWMTSTNVDSFPQKTGLSILLTATLATTIFRCWFIILFFSVWATVVALISDKVKVLSLPNTLITMFGAVLGVAISYRTSSSFERYNEGRRYWSSIAQASRVLARTIWINVPEERPPEGATEKQKDQLRLKASNEKKSAINLIDAFAVSVKHRLRGEEGIFYEDLYHLVKDLPVFRLLADLPQVTESPTSKLPEEGLASGTSTIQGEINLESPVGSRKNPVRRAGTDSTVPSTFHSPQESESSISTPAATSHPKDGLSIVIELTASADVPAIPMTARSSSNRLGLPVDLVAPAQAGSASPPAANDLPKGAAFDFFPLNWFIKLLFKKGGQSDDIGKAVNSVDAPATPMATRPSSSRLPVDLVPFPQADSQRRASLLPANDPPRWAAFDVFPLNLFINPLFKKGNSVAGTGAAELKARAGKVNPKIPSQITVYLDSYIAEIQHRKIADVPTLNLLLNNLNLLSDSLTGLERILTTPIPFSYTFHLWAVVTIFITLLPFQLWTTFGYATIPATAIAAFVFFGFLAAGEEIENPFGYHLNNLNLDHFTRDISTELATLTSCPPPSLEDWVPSPDDNTVFRKNEVRRRRRS